MSAGRSTARYRETQGDPIRGFARQALFASAVSLLLLALWTTTPVAVLAPAIPAGILGFLATIRFPRVASVIVLFLAYFKPNEIAPALSPLAVLQSAGIALVTIAFFWHLLCARSVTPDLRGPSAAIFVLWLCSTVSLVFARDHSLAFKVWSDYSKTLLVALVMLTFITTREHFRLLTRMFALGSALLSASTIVNSWLGVDVVEGSRFAVGAAGAMSNPNDLALVLLTPAPFAVEMSLRSRSRLERLLGIVSVALTVWAIILTQSRGGLLGLVTVGAILGSRYVRSKVLLVVLGAIFALVLYSAMGIENRESGGAKDMKGESAQDRVYAWRAGVNMAKAYPLSGVGIGNFAAQFPNYTPEQTQHPLTAHSIWFLSLGELGVPGFLAFVAAILMLLRQLVFSLWRAGAGLGDRELLSDGYATLAALGGFLVSGSFLSFVYQWPLYVLVLMSAVIARRSAPRTMSR